MSLANKFSIKTKYEIDKFIDHIDDMVFIHSVDNSILGKFLTVNNVVLEKLKYKYDEITEMSPKDITVEDNVNPKLNEKDNYFFKRKFIVKNGDIIPVEINSHQFTIESKKLAISIARDISDRIALEDKLEYQNRLKEKVLDISRRFIGLDDYEEVDIALSEVIKELGLIMNADYSYIYLIDENEKEINKIYNWCKDNDIKNLIFENRDDFKELNLDLLLPELKDMNNIIVRNKDEKDYYKNNKKLCKMLDSQNISACFIIPLIFKGKFQGLLGLDSIKPREWSQTEIGTLEIISDILINIIKQKETEERLRERKELLERVQSVLKENQTYLQQLFDRSPDAIVLLDPNERVIKINQSFQELFEYKQSEIEGSNINDIIVPEELIEEGEKATQQVVREEIYINETIRESKSGEMINVSIVAYPIIQGDEVIGIYAFYKDISDRKKEEDRIKYLSFHDQLTGLYNRRYFENEMDKLNDSRKYPISIIVADLNYLKEINDNYGHATGDRYIKLSATVLDDATRHEDIVARIGGDEFAVLLPETNFESAKLIVERINSRLDDLNKTIDPEIMLALGSATAENSHDSLELIFKKADNRMYRNKAEIKNNPNQ